jgi:hypothetical protein
VGYPTLAQERVFDAAHVTFLRATPAGFSVLDGPHGQPVESRHAAGFPTFNEDLLQPSRLAPGELQLRAAGRGLFVVPNDDSSAQYRHGVAIDANGRGGYTFYFLADAAENIPVHAGDTLLFEGSGRARVKQVDVAAQGGKYSVFVSVDRRLDPDSDGFPHAIFIRP